jgi:S-adenosylmethionine:tRNA ribosyltransferase-isomerase
MRSDEKDIYRLDCYDYELPERCIAQQPAERRSDAKLLVLNRQDGSLRDDYFYNLQHYLGPQDILVLNNTKVLPFRIYTKKETGGRVELLLIRRERLFSGGEEWQCLIRAAKRPAVGSQIRIDAGSAADVLEDYGAGRYRVALWFEGPLADFLNRVGCMPLPPYIRRSTQPEESLKLADYSRYQTVFASNAGSVAAPTAGFHYTAEVLEQLRQRQVSIQEITLHVGIGTFLPIRCEDIREHQIHEEYFEIPPETANAVQTGQQQGRRIIANGTTVVRTLEYALGSEAKIARSSGNCNLYIYPGFKFGIVNGMITNFHLPKSTLMLLVSAFAGYDNIMRAYHHAIAHDYRFYSYGDAMLIL